jgi:hypothetical protein
MMQKRRESKVGRPTRTRPPSATPYQAIKMPIAALRESIFRACPASPFNFSLRHRRAAGMRQRRPKFASGAGRRSIFRQFWRRPDAWIKAAPPSDGLNATSGMKAGRLRQPFVRPKRWSSAHCLTRSKTGNAQELHISTYFLPNLHSARPRTISQLVTTRERVGRTMEVSVPAQRRLG